MDCGRVADGASLKRRDARKIATAHMTGRTKVRRAWVNPQHHPHLRDPSTRLSHGPAKRQ